MFRPINSDDHTKFRPPAEQVRQTDPTHASQKRDFGLEIEQVNRDKPHKREHQEEPFGEDTFERTDSQTERETRDEANTQDKSRKQNPDSGHVDVQA